MSSYTGNTHHLPNLGGQEVRLGRALGFTPGDLAANRAGRISRRQSEAIYGAVFGYVFLGLCIAGLGTAIGVQLLRDPAAPRLALLFPLFCFALGYWVGCLPDAARADIREERAASREGEARVGCASRSRGRYYLTLDGAYFSISGDASAALEPGQRYRVYYAPHSQRFLSIERADAA